MVLVGFGKRDLKDMLHKINTEEEEDLIRAPTKSPPRYRREAICSPEEIEAFMIYGRFVQEKLMRGEI
jgi:hypothetical protein